MYLLNGKCQPVFWVDSFSHYCVITVEGRKKIENLPILVTCQSGTFVLISSKVRPCCSWKHSIINDMAIGWSKSRHFEYFILVSAATILFVVCYRLCGTLDCVLNSANQWLQDWWQPFQCMLEVSIEQYNQLVYGCQSYGSHDFGSNWVLSGWLGRVSRGKVRVSPPWWSSGYKPSTWKKSNKVVCNKVLP